MITLTRSARVLIHAPPQIIFEYVSDLTRHPEWSGGRLRIDALTSESIGVGKEYLSHGDVAVLKDRPNRVRITEYEPPHRFGFVANDPDFGEVSHVFTFNEQDRGTLVARAMTLSLNPVMAFLFRFFIYPFFGKPGNAKSLAALKAKLDEKKRSSCQTG